MDVLRRQHGYTVSHTGNADEIPVWFNAPRKGARSVSVRTTGTEQVRCTVMVHIRVDSRKPPPYVVFRRTTLLKEKFPRGIIVHVQEKGCMSNELVDMGVGGGGGRKKKKKKNAWANRPRVLFSTSILTAGSFI